MTDKGKNFHAEILRNAQAAYAEKILGDRAKKFDLKAQPVPEKPEPQKPESNPEASEGFKEGQFLQLKIEGNLEDWQIISMREGGLVLENPHRQDNGKNLKVTVFESELKDWQAGIWQPSL